MPGAPASVPSRRRHPGPGFLIGLGVVLWGLAALSYGVTHLPLGAWALPVALLIATLKASLIAAWYMHLVEGPSSRALVLVTAVVFVLLLAGLTTLETATRTALVRPPGPFAPEVLPGRGPAPVVPRGGAVE